MRDACAIDAQLRGGTFNDLQVEAVIRDRRRAREHSSDRARDGSYRETFIVARGAAPTASTTSASPRSTGRTDRERDDIAPSSVLSVARVELDALAASVT